MTVETAAMVEWWPLVDVARLKLGHGDLLLIRVNDKPLEGKGDETLYKRLHASMAEHFPGLRYIVVPQRSEFEFAVKHVMREMRAEDLVQPVRRSTME